METKLPRALMEAAEAACEAFQKHVGSFGSVEKNLDRQAFIAGFEACFQHLSEQAGEFDEGTAELDSEGYEHDVYMADPDGVHSHPAKHWVDGRRFQHQQSAAVIQALRENNLYLSTLNHDAATEIERLRAELAEARETIRKVEFATAPNERGNTPRNAAGEALALVMDYQAKVSDRGEK